VFYEGKSVTEQFIPVYALDLNACSGDLNEEIDAVSFAIAGHLKEYDFGLFNQ
jgi:hypothetical protein